MSLKKLREEVQKFVTPDLIRQVYMHCINKDPDGLYPEEIDLIEFSERMIAVIGKNIAEEEAKVCVEIVRKLNPEVANKLHEMRAIGHR